ncbi:hypothetical protein [Reichenbachiella sp. MALMAid0571]|uniref:hypothetical protein n=1 Tax=Reichenbachiella sp. MALMAid0571 TaxID=3143939 RepID=UPI0032DF6E79
MLFKIKFYLIRLIFFLGIISIGLLITGSIDRDYIVSSPDTQINLKLSDYSPYDLAKKYMPKVSFSIEDDTQLENIFYEVIEEDSEVAINYYFVWNKENNPEFIRNIANKIWHFIYFRFSLLDIEFLQINIDKTTGEIILAKSINQNVKKPSFPVCVSINSWNHDFSFCSSDEGKLLETTLLTYFENTDYSSLKMARRSQGDFKTKDNVMNYPFIIFLALLATYYFRHLQKDYNNEYSET